MGTPVEGGLRARSETCGRVWGARSRRSLNSRLRYGLNNTEASTKGGAWSLKSCEWGLHQFSTHFIHCLLLAPGGTWPSGPNPCRRWTDSIPVSEQELEPTAGRRRGFCHCYSHPVKLYSHWPAAITWHTHRQEMTALRKQFYGYSAGLSAFYASMVRSRPAAAFDVLRLVPHAVRDLKRGSDNQRSGQLPDDFPAYLLKAARRGLLEGGFMYAYEAIRDRQPIGTANPEGCLRDAAYP